jgi:hypothetical protein
VQHQQLGWVDPLDDEPGGTGRPVGDAVADLEWALQLGNQLGGAGPVAWEQQPVDQAGGVPAAAVPAHLDQPRPHLVGRYRDGGGVVGDHGGVVDEFVAG